jgi:hypothetical protein
MASITRFDPETVAVLAAAFDEAWSWLQTSGSECARPAYARAMREVVARASSRWQSRASRTGRSLPIGLSDSWLLTTP